MKGLQSAPPFAPAGDWVIWAACRAVDPDLMYPDRQEVGQTAAARAVCTRCPVRAQCLEYVMATESQVNRHGVWGGLTPDQRRELFAASGMARPQPIQHGTPAGARAHYRRGEELCMPCRIANREQTAETKAKSRSRRAS